MAKRIGGEEMLAIPKSKIWSNVHQNSVEIYQIRVICGLRRPRRAYCSLVRPNVGLVLFTDPTVVTVQVLTIRTVYRA